MATISVEAKQEDHPALATSESPSDALRSPARAVNGKKSPTHPQLYAKEVVGRRVQVCRSKASQVSNHQKWEEGKIRDYNPATGQHKVKFVEGEEWAVLSSYKLKWPADPPVNAEPNPTFLPSAPKGEAAVGRRVRVYWPGMKKWYLGVVRSYDSATDKHRVDYKDGDTAEYQLRHEPVQWVDEGKENGVSLCNGNSGDCEVELSGGKVRSHPCPPVKGCSADGDASKSNSANENGACSVPQALPHSSVCGKDNQLSPSPDTIQLADHVLEGQGEATFSSAPCISKESPPKPQQAQQSEQTQLHPPPVACAGSAGAAVAAEGNGGQAPDPGGQSDICGASAPLLGAGRGSCAGGRGTKRGRGRGRGAGRGGRVKEESDSEEGRKRSAGPEPPEQPGAKRPRRQTLGRGQTLQEPDDANSILVGARIGVWWDGDDTFYRGKVTAYGGSPGRYQLRYDDGESEWLQLDREQFQWYMPRGISAGYRPRLHHVIVQLGARNVPIQPVPSEPSSRPDLGATAPAQPQDAAGRRLAVYWQGDGQWHGGEVLSYSAKSGRHHVLYADGEDEWLDLDQEGVAWAKVQRGASHAPVGINHGGTTPSGRRAVGWRVAVYWKDDATFYEGKIVSYDNVTGRHTIRYDDNESEQISLHGEKIIWRLPAGVGDNDDSDEEDDEDKSVEDEDEEPSRPLARRRSRSTPGAPEPEHPMQLLDGRHSPNKPAAAPASSATGSAHPMCSLPSKHALDLAARSAMLTDPSHIRMMMPYRPMPQMGAPMIPRPGGPPVMMPPMMFQMPYAMPHMIDPLAMSAPDAHGCRPMHCSPFPAADLARRPSLLDHTALQDTAASPRPLAPSSHPPISKLEQGSDDGTHRAHLHALPSHCRLDVSVIPDHDANGLDAAGAGRLPIDGASQQLLNCLHQRLQVLHVMSSRISAAEAALGWTLTAEVAGPGVAMGGQRMMITPVAARKTNSVATSPKPTQPIQPPPVLIGAGPWRGSISCANGVPYVDTRNMMPLLRPPPRAPPPLLVPGLPVMQQVIGTVGPEGAMHTVPHPLQPVDSFHTQHAAHISSPSADAGLNHSLQALAAAAAPAPPPQPLPLVPSPGLGGNSQLPSLQQQPLDNDLQPAVPVTHEQRAATATPMDVDQPAA